MATQLSKNRVGRPSRNIETRRCNVHIEAALYDYIISHKGDMTVTEYINSLIRKEVNA